MLSACRQLALAWWFGGQAQSEFPPRVSLLAHWARGGETALLSWGASCFNMWVCPSLRVPPVCGFKGKTDAPMFMFRPILFKPSEQRPGFMIRGTGLIWVCDHGPVKLM